MFNSTQNRDKIMRLDMCLQENNEIVKDIIHEANRRLPTSNVPSNRPSFKGFAEAFNFAQQSNSSWRLDGSTPMNLSTRSNMNFCVAANNKRDEDLGSATPSALNVIFKSSVDNRIGPAEEQGSNESNLTNLKPLDNVGPAKSTSRVNNSILNYKHLGRSVIKGQQEDKENVNVSKFSPQTLG